MSAAYFNAAFPKPYQILGLTLETFSLGHYMLLQALGCKFVSDDEQEPELKDLVVGLLVCSKPHDEFSPFLKSGEADEFLAEWGRKAGGFDFEEKCKLFSEYLREAVPKPFFEILTDSEPNSGREWAQSLLSSAIDAGYSRAEALSCPMAQLLMDFYARADAAGTIRLMSEQEYAEMIRQGEENAKIMEAALGA